MASSGGGIDDITDYRFIDTFTFSSSVNNNTFLLSAKSGHTLAVHNKTRGENVLFKVLSDYVSG